MSGAMPRSYSTGPKPFHFTRLQASPAMSPMPTPATYQKPRGRDRSPIAACCCCFFCSICSVLFTLIIGLGIAALVLWLVLKPIHTPKYSVDSVDVKTLSVSSDGKSLDANFLYTITANNPNRKIGFKYEVINLDTSFSGDVFGHSTIPGFYQGHQNITTLTSGFDVKGFTFSPPTLGATLLSDISANSIPLTMRASVKVRVKVGVLTIFPIWLHVNCDVTITPPSLTNGAKLISNHCKLTR